MFIPLLILSTIVQFIQSSSSFIQRVGSNNPIQIQRANYLKELWKYLSPSSSGDIIKLKDFEYDDRVKSIEKGIDSHLTFCKDAGMIQYSSFKTVSYGILDKEQIGNVPLYPIRDDMKNREILDVSKQWIKRMIAGFGICPFTIDDIQAGIPRGGIHYAISDAITIEQAMTDYWEQVELFLSTDSNKISTILLIYSQSNLFTDIKHFEKYCECLDHSILNSCTDLEKDIQMVYFHPEFEFTDKDGQAYFIFDADGNVLGLSTDFVTPISYARRSPWPIINILRTAQVNNVQKGIPPGKVFAKNSEMLNQIGSAALQTMLDSKDWSNLPLNAPYLKQVLQNQYVDAKQSSSQITPLNSVETSDSISIENKDVEVVEDVMYSLSDMEKKKKDGEMSAEDYVNLADRIEKWLESDEEK